MDVGGATAWSMDKVLSRAAILEILGRLCGDKIAIRDNHDGILAMSCHELRTVAKRSVDNLAETRFGVLKFPGIHSIDPGQRLILVSVSQKRKSLLLEAAQTACR